MKDMMKKMDRRGRLSILEWKKNECNPRIKWSIGLGEAIRPLAIVHILVSVSHLKKKKKQKT